MRLTTEEALLRRRERAASVAKERVVGYAEHAANVLRHHANTKPHGVRSPSYSAAMLMLSKLLGKEFTKQLWAAQAPIKAYYYRCDSGTLLIDEHVVPLGVILRRVLGNP
jgi:hypothetical protein